METYGDLKQTIKAIGLKQKGKAIGNLAIDVALDMIPGVGLAKTTFDFIEAAFNKPDTKKTNSWLDKLDVDDDMSSIVDDTVENGFLKMIAKTIDSEPDDKPLESDFNMNQRMVDYLKQNYGGRTIIGIKEMEDNNTIQRMKELAGVQNKETPAITNIDKDLSDRSSDFKQINTKQRLIEFLDKMVEQLDPKFRDSPPFNQGIREFFTKHK